MLVRPMIGSWEPSGLESISSVETRRLAVLAIPGLQGDLQQDMGRGMLAVRIQGSLSGDEARDRFLEEVRAQFLAGEPVDFIADIMAESELEQVMIARLELAEVAGQTDDFRYDIVLTEYTEPPEPPGLGFDADLDLGLDIDLGLDLLDLPGLLGDVPEIGPLLQPVRSAADELAAALGGAGAILAPLDDVLG